MQLGRLTRGRATSARARPTLLAALILFLESIFGDPQEVKVASGQDVTLRCQAPSGACISQLVWSRSDLKDDYFVYFLRDGLHMNYQRSSYVGRVELRDPQMKDGDASIVLKNVIVSDSGTYECRVGEKNTPDLIGIIRLTVSGSAPCLLLSVSRLVAE
ncbi:nectin-4-like isoform X2 [Micropterus salmoides]|uniref:nectin-4-like isoform X2 n=1 Tax=Micropterus salmoides TaxID=27706 RepID=UPI0018EB85E4|nr:nectin-4-like isoform X2 [Micropterus salmoides]